MKYIIIEHCPNLPCAVIFDELLAHDKVASAFPDKKILSAGFLSATGQVSGKSVSLNLKSRPEDRAIISKSSSRTAI